MRICKAIPNLVKVVQKLRTLNEKLRPVGATAAGDIKLPQKRSIRKKSYRVFKTAEEVNISCERDEHVSQPANEHWIRFCMHWVMKCLPVSLRDAECFLACRLIV